MVEGLKKAVECLFLLRKGTSMLFVSDRWKLLRMEIFVGSFTALWRSLCDIEKERRFQYKLVKTQVDVIKNQKSVLTSLWLEAPRLP